MATIAGSGASFFAKVPLDQSTSVYLADVLQQVQDLLDQATQAVADVEQAETDVEALLVQAQALIATIPASGESPWKDTVRLSTSSNIDVSSPPGAFDGVSAVLGDRILLFGQSTAANNGPWLFNGTGIPMTRPVDFNSASNQVPGTIAYATEGVGNGGTLFVGSGSAGSLTFAPLSLGGAAPLGLRLFDISGFLQGVPPVSTTVFAYCTPRDLTLSSGLEGTVFKAGTPPTGLVAFELLLDGTKIADVNFEANGDVNVVPVNPTASEAAPAGSELSLVTPASVNDVADISFTIVSTVDV